MEEGEREKGLRTINRSIPSFPLFIWDDVLYSVRLSCKRIKSSTDQVRIEN